MDVSAKAWDRLFDWWVGVAEEYLDLVKRHPYFLQWMGITLQHHLEAKKGSDILLQRMWRQMGLPPLQEITRLHERLALLESRLSGSQEEDLPGLQPTPRRVGGDPQKIRVIS